MGEEFDALQLRNGSLIVVGDQDIHITDLKRLGSCSSLCG